MLLSAAAFVGCSEASGISDYEFIESALEEEEMEPEQDNPWNRMQESTENTLPEEMQPPVTVPAATRPMETEPEETEPVQTESTETEPGIVLEENLPFGML